MNHRPPLTIERLGSGGDGIATGSDGEPVYVPFALPGDTVADGGHGPVSETAPDRQTPPCLHFGACGGCIAQHMRPRLYETWKRDLVVTAFRQHGLTPEIGPLVTVPPSSRRRAAFALAPRTSSLGFHRRASEDVVPVTDCKVITAKMLASLAPLQRLASALPARGAEVRLQLSDYDGRLDLTILGLKANLSPGQKSTFARLATEAGLARLSLGADVLVEREAPILATRAGAIDPPPAAFFQAAARAEQAIVDAVMAALPARSKRVADLFCGIGTLSLPLATRARVFALDSDSTALAALTGATRRNQGLKPIETRARDLFKEPLSIRELAGLDAVVLDPPRAGAREQCSELAKARDLKSVVYVSCNPATLARDARTLVDAGYKLAKVSPIDQFLWSPHVECVATFAR